MSIGTLLLIILVITLLGGFSGWGGGPFYGMGYYGGGGLLAARHCPRAGAYGTRLTTLGVPHVARSGIGRGGGHPM